LLGLPGGLTSFIIRATSRSSLNEAEKSVERVLWREEKNTWILLRSLLEVRNSRAMSVDHKEPSYSRENSTDAAILDHLLETNQNLRESFVLFLYFSSFLLDP